MTTGREPPPGGYPHKEKYVLFIDMLGFSQAVALAEGNDEKRQELTDIIRGFQTKFGNYERLDVRVTNFSDCLIVSAERSEQGLALLLSNSMWLALEFLQHPVLLRGGIAVGGITHESDMVFGIGVIRAHDFDKSELPPRIGLSPEVVSDIASSPLLSAHNLVVTDTKTGKPMLHILLEVENYGSSPPQAGDMVWERHAAEITEAIRLSLNAPGQSEKVSGKYVWTADYWNRSVAKNNILPRV